MAQKFQCPQCTYTGTTAEQVKRHQIKTHAEVVWPSGDREKVTPEMRAQSDKDNKNANLGCLVVFLLLIGGCWAFSSMGGDKGTSDGPTSDGAIDVCHQSVKGQLKAPSTADFGGEYAYSDDGQTYKVTGWVDSDNSFGAHVRTDWSCEATFSDGDYWKPVVSTLDE